MNTQPRCISSQLVVRLAAIAASVVLSGYAQAGTPTVKVSETVRAVDVNLDTREGARELYVRLKAASHRVCNDTRVGLAFPQAGCIEEALGNAIRSVNQPQLTMVYLRTHSIQTAETYGIRIPIWVADK